VCVDLFNETERANLAHKILTRPGRADGGGTFDSSDSNLSERENEAVLLNLLAFAGVDVATDGQIQRLCNLEPKLEVGYKWISRLYELRLGLTLAIENGWRSTYDIEWDLVHGRTSICRGTGGTGTIRVPSMRFLCGCHLRANVKRQR
jgi:hypothetical protein